MSQFAAVTFDVGGTLITPWPSVGQVYAESARRHGMKDVSAEQLHERFVRAWAAREQFMHTRAEWAALVDETFAGLCQVPPSATFFPELYERFGRAIAWRLFDDVEPALKVLRERRLKLGVISNWDERLRPLLREFGLDGYFQSIVVSCQAGVCKPARAIFDQAAKELGLAPSAILHVGDSYEHDVVGARQAGFESLLIKRGEQAKVGDQIGSLMDLVRA